jgi:hypothetical protein
MKKKLGLSLLAALATVALAATASVQAQVASMTFFVTSVGKGNGADLGGLEALTHIARRWPGRPARRRPTGEHT